MTSGYGLPTAQVGVVLETLLRVSVDRAQPDRWSAQTWDKCSVATYGVNFAQAGFTEGFDKLPVGLRGCEGLVFVIGGDAGVIAGTLGKASVVDVSVSSAR